MNIVILRTNTCDFGKVGSYNVQEIGLANALIKKGHKVSVLFMNRKTKEIIVDEKYDYVYYLPHKTFGLHGIFDVELLKKFAPERIIMFSDNQLWAKNVILWAKKNNVTCIQYMGAVLSNTPFWLNQLYTKLILIRNRKSYNYSVNIAKTQKVRMEMEKLNVSCGGVINVGLDEELLNNKRNLDKDIRKELGFSEEDIVLLYVGRLSPYKKPLDACDILKAMLKKFSNTKLILIGQGEMEEELNNKIQELNISEYVIRKKHVPYKDMYKYMVSSDCCINTSHVEIFGMTILECMYYGLPVVAHVAPGPCEIIENQVSGYLCDSEDVDEWVKLIDSAISNKTKIIKEAYKTVIDNFMWDKIADKFMNVER